MGTKGHQERLQEAKVGEMLYGGTGGGETVWKYNTPPLSAQLDTTNHCLSVCLMLPGKFEVWLKAEI